MIANNVCYQNGIITIFVLITWNDKGLGKNQLFLVVLGEGFLTMGLSYLENNRND